MQQKNLITNKKTKTMKRIFEMVANNILKKIIPDFEKVNYMPIMLEIDSSGNYSHWRLGTPSSCAPNEN
jgi:hypothetical protein